MEVQKVKSSGTRRLDDCSKDNAYAAAVTYTPKSMHSQSKKETHTLTPFHTPPQSKLISL
jgi:hypothetical protein